MGDEHGVLISKNHELVPLQFLLPVSLFLTELVISPCKIPLLYIKKGVPKKLPVPLTQCKL